MNNAAMIMNGACSHDKNAMNRYVNVTLLKQNYMGCVVSEDDVMLRLSILVMLNGRTWIWEDSKEDLAGATNFHSADPLRNVAVA